METHSVTSEAPAAAPPARPNGLDKEAFMKLLITQLRHQDPLKAQDDKEFIAQLAQFSALEQSQQLSKSLTALLSFQQLAQGSALVGRRVEVLDAKQGPMQGVVQEVRLGEGGPRVVIDGRAYDTAAIQRLL